MYDVSALVEGSRLWQLMGMSGLRRVEHRRAVVERTFDVESLEIRLVPAAVQVIPVTPLVTTESGGTAVFNVTLASQPKAKVTIPVTTSNAREGSVDVKKLVFSPANWSSPQAVTVKGVDDAFVDGNQNYGLTLGKNKSSDKAYKSLAPVVLNLSNTDNDIPGIRVTAGSVLTTSEAGGKATVTLKLGTKPTANVVIPIRSSNVGEGTVVPSLTFTPLNWNQSQTITITGVNDFQIDGNQSYEILFDPAQSSDPVYAGMTVGALSVTNTDNDFAGLTISPTTSISVNEGSTKLVGIRLNAQPTADVVVNLLPVGGVNQASLSATSLTFTPDNWDVPQNVTITGLLGDGADGDQIYTFQLDVQSEDPLFEALESRTVSTTVRNVEVQAAVVVNPKSGLTVNEGASRSLSFKLSTQPTADVVVNLTTTSGADQATLSTSTLTFTSSNWNTIQNVSVTGLTGDGIDADALLAFDIDTVSADSQFNILPTQSVSVTIHDPDAPLPTLDGVYTGSYSGTISTFGLSQSVSGTIAATISGNSFVMTEPVPITKTLPGDGTVNIAIPVSAAAFSGVSFTGTTTRNPDGSVTISGTWTITKLGVHGNGTWSLRRAPL